MPSRLPAAATPLYVHAQVAQNAAGGADAVAFDLLGIDVYSAVDGRFDPRDLGAVGDGATDDQPAFHAALWTASRFVGAGGTAAGGVSVVVPPGNYLMSSPLALCGSVRFEGTCGSGPECPCILTFAPDIGAPDDADDTVVEGCLVVNHRGQAPVPVWKPNATYVVGDIVQPNANWNGYYYRCVASANPHQSGAAEPNDWQTSFGSDNPAADGDITWTCWGYLPSATGAIVGSQLRHERRLTGAFATDAAGTEPDTTNMNAAFGFYRPGDLVLNLWADNDTWADSADMKWPVAWRPAGFGGVTIDVWQDNYAYRVGDVVLANGMSYRAETAGYSGGAAPNWAGLAPNLGDVFPIGSFDGAVQWRNVGAATDDLPWVPLIIESPLLYEKDVTNDDPGVAYVQMSEEESAHARIRFGGAPNAARTVKVAPGCADGWVRHFRNECGQDVTVTMVGAGGGAATVLMATGTTASIFSDGTNCYAT